MDDFFRKIIIASISLTILFFISGCQVPWQKQNQNETPVLMEDEQNEKIRIIIDNGVDEPDDLKFKPDKENTTAYDMLKKATEWAGYGLETKENDFGISIVRIGNYKTGDSGKYWVYYLNDEISPIAIDKYKVRGGDKLEFRFEEGE